MHIHNAGGLEFLPQINLQAVTVYLYQTLYTMAMDFQCPLKQYYWNGSNNSAQLLNYYYKSVCKVC